MGEQGHRGDDKDEWDDFIEDLEWDDPRPETATTATTANNGKEQVDMANVEQSLKTAMDISGAVGAALVDYETGMTLGASGGGGLNLEVAAAGNTDVVRAKMRVMDDLGISGGIQDILISLETQYHLIRPLSKSSLFLYLVIDRKSGNLAMARHKLAAVEADLKV